MLRFRIESVMDIWPELVELHEANWRESGKAVHGRTFKPDAARYFSYEERGWYLLYTVRDDAEVLLGTLGVYLNYSMHSGHMIACDDGLYLHPSIRGTHAVRDMIRIAERDLWRRGVKEIIVTAKNDRIGALLRRLDFEPMNVQYSKQAGADSAVVSTSAVREPSHDAPSGFSRSSSGTV